MAKSPRFATEYPPQDLSKSDPDFGIIVLSEQTIGLR